MDINVDDIVVFHAYDDAMPIKSKVTAKGTLKELGKMYPLKEPDDRIFYLLDTVGLDKNFNFTCTMASSIKDAGQYNMLVRKYEEEKRKEISC